jgi:hypothetical protein
VLFRSPLPPKPLPPKPLPPKPLPPPPPPPPGTKKPTQEKPAIKSKFPNATKAYNSKERASLDPVIKENQKEFESIRENIIKETANAQKELESAESKYQEIQQNLKETQLKISKLVETRDKPSVDAKSYAEAKSQLEEEFNKRQALKEELQMPERLMQEARQKVREIGLNAIRKDMLDINKQDGFTPEQLSKATEELKQKQQAAIATDKRSIRESKGDFATTTRQKGQDVLRSIFNPNIHSESLSKPIKYSGTSREYSDGGTIEFIDGTRVGALNGIVINKNTSLKTILHEYGHQVENGSPEAHDLCSDFLKKRTSGAKVEKFQKVFRGYGFRKEEEGSPDDFEKSFKNVFPERDAKKAAYYAGKVYKESSVGASSKSLAATEVYSMGLELLHHNPVKFAQTDPEWFDLVSGIATGRLLKKTRGLK